MRVPAHRRAFLLADDNADALQTLSFLLEAQGHRVLIASNGDEALALAESGRPDVAVLDIGMPGLNGYDAARSIRGASWGTAMQLIALTGWGQAEDLARSHAAGCDHHLTKPVEFDVLQELVRRGRWHPPLRLLNSRLARAALLSSRPSEANRRGAVNSRNYATNATIEPVEGQ